MEGRGVQIAAADEFDELACAGLDGVRREVGDYEEEIAALAERDVLMHCLNPDRLVIRGGVPEPCAGAIADRYIELGGRETPDASAVAEIFAAAGIVPKVVMQRLVW